MDDHRVLKRRVSIEIAIAHAGRRSVSVFLSEFASHHAGPERVSDLLNGDADFIPAVVQGSEATTFYQRQGLLCAWVAPDEEAPPTEAHTVPTGRALELTLSDGTLIRGQVGYVLPPERARLIDFLNEAPAFFRLLAADRVALINKRHVTQVVPLDG
jgi:hypothetical protein